MVKFDVDDDGEFLDQQPDQGDCSSMSDDDDSLDQQTDLGDDSFMSDDDQQSDDITSGDDDPSLDEQSGQEDDADNVFITAELMEAIRSFRDRGFHTPAGAGAGDADDPEGTFSEYYVFNLPRRGVPGLRRSWWPSAATNDDDAAEDEDDPFPAPAPPATASLAAIAALEAVDPPADDCCPVCLQDGAASAGAAWKRVAACGHRFHASCVAQWLRVKLSCPVCRCPAAYPATSAAAAEPPRPPLPAIVEEALAMSYEELDVFVQSSRWLEFMDTRNSPGVSAGAV